MENSTQVVSRSWGHDSGMAGPKKAQYLPWAQPNPAGRPVCPAPYLPPNTRDGDLGRQTADTVLPWPRPADQPSVSPVSV